MKIAGLVILVLVFVGVLVVSTVVIRGHRLGMLRDRQNSKGGVDLVSAGEASLSDESPAAETEVDSSDNSEKHQLSPAEMQKLMQEAGANDDGPGPGYDAKSDPYNPGGNSGGETGSTGIPVGLSFRYRKEMKIECGGGAPDANFTVDNNTGRVVSEGEVSVKIAPCEYFEIIRAGFRPWALTWMIDESNPSCFKDNVFPKALEKLLGDGFDIPRLLPGSSAGCSVPLRIKEGTPQRDTSLTINYYAKAKNDSGWTSLGDGIVWY